MRRKTAADFDPQVMKLFDQYVRGMLDRRGLLVQAGKYCASAVTAEGLLAAYRRSFQPDPVRLRRIALRIEPRI